MDRSAPTALIGGALFSPHPDEEHAVITWRFHVFILVPCRARRVRYAGRTPHC